VLTRFGKWDEMLAQPEPREKNAYLQAMYRYARGLAFLGKRKTGNALAERERMEAMAGRVPEGETLMINASRDVLAVGLADLDARISRARGDRKAEIAHWRRAVELQDRLKYMEPPEWHYSVREALGGALLRNRNADEAEAVFREDLRQNPRNGRSLFGLLESLRAQQKDAGVEWVKREFGEAWKNSTLSLAIDDL
ncbi:MAG: hypothetical protein ACRD8O_11680, partial [Bryobacteraceae bacterium]